MPDDVRERLALICGNVKQGDNAYGTADAILREFIVLPHWIPVSQFPARGKYLTFGAGATPRMHVSSFGWSAFIGQPCDANGNAFPPTVTHWLPLPEPPKGG